MRSLLLCLIAFTFVSCASTAGTKQIITVDVLKPTLDALGTFQDTERALFAAHTMPQLTDAAHQRIAAKLEVAFRAEVAAATALKAWQPGQPIPVDVTQIMAAVSSLHELLGLLNIPATSPLQQQSSSTVSIAASLLAKLGGH